MTSRFVTFKTNLLGLSEFSPFTVAPRTGPCKLGVRREMALQSRRGHRMKLADKQMPYLPSGSRERRKHSPPLPGSGRRPVALGLGKGLGCRPQSVSSRKASEKPCIGATGNAPRKASATPGALSKQTQKQNSTSSWVCLATKAWHVPQAAARIYP